MQDFLLVTGQYEVFRARLDRDIFHESKYPGPCHNHSPDKLLIGDPVKIRTGDRDRTPEEDAVLF